MKKRQKSPKQKPIESSSMFSPKESLKVMHDIGLGYSGHQKLRNVANQQGKPHVFPSKRKLDFERHELEKGVEYIIKDDVIELKSMHEAIEKRVQHIGTNALKAALLSVDKGQGRVLSTIAFPYRNQGKPASRPCSSTNHLVLKSWEGSDKYDTLVSRLSDIYDVVSKDMGLPVFIGGDLAFLCINFGKSAAMTQACPWCDHSFDKSKNANKNSIPFEPISLPRKKNAVAQQPPIWPVPTENVCFVVCSNGFFKIVPQMLHMKLKIGNQLHERLQTAADHVGAAEELKQLLKKHGLDKNRNEERIIHAEYKGNEVTKFRY